MTFYPKSPKKCPHCNTATPVFAVNMAINADNLGRRAAVFGEVRCHSCEMTYTLKLGLIQDRVTPDPNAPKEGEKESRIIAPPGA